MREASGSCSLGVRGKKCEWSPVAPADDPEVALIIGEHAVGSVELGEDDDRCVREAEAEIAVASDELAAARDLLGSEPDERVRTRGHFVEEVELLLAAHMLAQHVVDLCEAERREEERTLITLNGSSGGVVEWIADVAEREDTAGVDDDQSRPKPSRSSSSTRSARLPCENVPARGRGG